MKREIGRVTEAERDEIQSIFERRNGLEELSKILNEGNTELYERLVADLGTTATRFQKWWDRMSEKYDWESTEDGRWEIDFDSCEIFLVTPD